MSVETPPNCEGGDDNVPATPTSVHAAQSNTSIISNVTDVSFDTQTTALIDLSPNRIGQPEPPLLRGSNAI